MLKRNQKKILFIMICMIAGLFVGCGEMKSSKKRTFDDEKAFLFMSNLAESDKGVYQIEWGSNLAFNKLFFVDKKTAKRTVLCQELNCKHDSKECQAVVEESGVMGCAVYSKGMIYYMVFDREKEPVLELYSMKEDGTNKKLEHTFQYADMFPNAAGLYQGKLFLSVQTMTTDEEGRNTTVAEPSILVYDLKTKEEAVLIDGAENKGKYVIPCGGYENSVYFAQMPWDYVGEEQPLTVLEYHLETEAWSVFWETTQKNYQPITADFVYRHTEEGRQLEKYNLKTKESNVVLEWEEDVDKVAIGIGFIELTKEVEEDGMLSQYCNWYDLTEKTYLFEEYQGISEVDVKGKMENGYWTVKDGEICFYYPEDGSFEKVDEID